MGKRIFWLIAAMVTVFSFTGCGVRYRYPYVANQQFYPTPQARTSGVFYRSRNMTNNGTRIRGTRSSPIGLYWLDMAIERKGMIVTVIDGQGRILNQYDLRISGQDVDDYYAVTGFTGLALEVNVVIRGGTGSVNFINVNGGCKRERYSLTRD